MMALRRLPAAFWRGGTSNGLVIHRKDLPEDLSQWSSVLCPAMGSPDPYGRQLNGMGGGISSLSKICVVSPSTGPDADVDFTFVQVGIKRIDLDMAGNCGNMSSAVGPFALDEGLLSTSSMLKRIQRDNDQDFVTVRIRNTNTAKIIDSKFAIRKSDNELLAYDSSGDYSIDGVSGTGSPIALSFLSPGGAKTGKIFPSGNRTDILELSNGESVMASLVDVANPAVFVRASDLGLSLPTDAAILQQDSLLMSKVEDLRRLGASCMGLDPKVESVPKILLLSTPETNEASDIRTLAFSMGQCHKAVPLTLSLNLGVSCRFEGTIPWSLRNTARPGAAQSTTIAHPSGSLEVQADIEGGEVNSAILMRTARLLMRGEVNIA